MFSRRISPGTFVRILNRRNQCLPKYAHLSNMNLIINNTQLLRQFSSFSHILFDEDKPNETLSRLLKKIKEIENSVNNQGDSNPDPKEDPPDNKKPKGRKIIKSKEKEKEKEKSSNNNSTPPPPPPPKDPKHNNNNNNKKEEGKKTSDNGNNNNNKEEDGSGNGGSLLPNIDPKISWYLLAALVCGVIAYDSAGKSNNREISYREFIDSYVSSNDVKEIIIQDSKIVYVISKTTGKNAMFTIGDAASFEKKLELDEMSLGKEPSEFIPIKYKYKGNSMLLPLLFNVVLPCGLLYLLYVMMTKGKNAGGGANMFKNMMGIGDVPIADSPPVKVKFKDVAGCDEAKMEIMEYVDFLKNSEKYSKLGARIPKGAILSGPPGTGKTLLAKAAAGEANVPFLSMSGSDFVEMYVGLGASRVRSLFEKARKKSPCIVFIDEIDAVARARSSNKMSSNDERENTLNALLVEMDGFKSTDSVVVLAATNRVDILDPALLRPGRFDRQIYVDKPDIKGREAIAKVHLEGKVLKEKPESMARRIASLTPGLTGAEISNICNEAAIFAARRDKNEIDFDDFESAIDRVVGGLEKKNAIITPEEKKTVAYHEAGHATVSWMLEYGDPLVKVTIVPRGPTALGYAQYLPKELHLYTKEQLMDKLCTALGGRASEEILIGKCSSGAANDLEQCTNIAYQMIASFGMSDKIGYVNYGSMQKDSFVKPYSDITARDIDMEVKDLLKEAYEKTKVIVKENEVKIKELGELLLEKETITQADAKEILGERKWSNPKEYEEFLDLSWREKDKKVAEEKKEKEEKKEEKEEKKE